MSEKQAFEIERIWQERRHRASTYLSDYDQRIIHWADHQKRVQDADRIARGDFTLVFPDDSSTTERPKVPNIVQLALEDRAALSSSIIPTVRCDPARESGRVRAEKKERIASYYLESNNIELLMPRLFTDLVLCGVNYKGVFPDFDTGFPRFLRFDPRQCFPDRRYSPDRPMRNFVVAYMEALPVLRGDYPDAAWPEKVEGDPSQLVQCLEWYDGSEFTKYAWVPVATGSGKGERFGIYLSGVPNLLKKVPIVASARTTHDGQFRGVFDQMLGVLGGENRIFNLLLDAAADWISSEKVSWNIENEDDIGSGRVLRAKGPDAFVRRMTPEASHPQMFAVLSTLQGNSRIGAVYPEARQGDIHQAIASAAFVTAITGNLATAVAQDQRTEAASWSRLLSMAFETDERWFGDSLKYIAGSARASRFSESYRPNDDISGDYRARLTYGGAAGQDQYGYEIRITQQAANKLLPKRWAMEELSTVDDVAEAEKILLQEQILEAGMSFIQAAAANPQQPNFAPASALLEALSDPKVDVFDVLKKFEQFQFEKPGAQGSGRPVTGTESFEQASAMQRGSQRTGALNVPGVGAAPSFPSLEELGITPGG